AGDITGGPYFTHYAGFQAFGILRNLLFPAPFKTQATLTHVPWAVFTDPEIAQAGITEAQARQQHGERIHITRLPMARSDRAMTEGKSAGFLKLVHLPNGKLLGATVVGLNAGDLINEWAHIIRKGGKLGDVSAMMRVYPSYSHVNTVLATEQLKRQIKTGVSGRVLRLAVRVLQRWA
ncbi:MAG: dihydrolipoamide dehydrogenase, partial [Armatimonadetes bacterium]|nr:dihydrolipoamide dehydrogenase [Anaerolineae bacterium]